MNPNKRWKKIKDLRLKVARMDSDAYAIDANRQEVRIRIARAELDLGELDLEHKKLDLERMKLLVQIKGLETDEMEEADDMPEKDCPERK